MMNNDGITGGNYGQIDDQQMITPVDRENYIARLTQHFHGNREMAKHLHDDAMTRSGGKAALYKKVLPMLAQQKTQQMQQQQSMMNSQQQQQQQSMMNSQQQQQQQQSMMNSQQQQQQQQSMMNSQQQQQQQMYMQSQQNQMVGMPQQQQQPPPSYTMQPPPPSSSMPSSTQMMNVKQEPQIPMQNVQMRPNPQNFPMQQQQIKQELMVPPIPQQQQQIKQELMIPPMQQQQQPGGHVQQMRQQQPPQYNQQPPLQYNQQQPVSLPSQPTTAIPQQRSIVQHLQQVRQQNHLNQQQQEPPNSIQLQQQQPSHPSTLPMNSGVSSSTPTTSAGSSDEILQQILTSPNPPKQPPTAVQNSAQARLRTMNRNIRNPSLAPSQIPPQQQPSPMTPGSDPMIIGNIPSPHSHPGMMQQPQTPIGPPGQSPLARYMMAQSPQPGIYRPQMSPMNMMNYPGSPAAAIEDEMHYLFKFFTDRIHYLTRIMARCQQEGQHEKVARYRQIHDQMATFVRNPIPEHLIAARRLREHVERLFDPRMFGQVMMPPTIDMTGMIPPGVNNARPMTNGIFEQCQRAIGDYLGKDTTSKYNVSKRFLEPLTEVINGVPHKSMRLDTESKETIESYSSSPNTHSLGTLVNIIENEFAQLSTNTFTYELKPLSDQISTLSSIIDMKDLSIRDYELTCRFIEINMPVVPPLKMKLSIRYPNEPPEVLSLTSTGLNVTPVKLQNSDGHSFFESISRNFIYFLFKLPAQHTVTDILDIWRTAIENASLCSQEL